MQEQYHGDQANDSSRDNCSGIRMFSTSDLEKKTSTVITQRLGLEVLFIH